MRRTAVALAGAAALLVPTPAAADPPDFPAARGLCEGRDRGTFTVLDIETELSYTCRFGGEPEDPRDAARTICERTYGGDFQLGEDLYACIIRQGQPPLD